MFGVGTTPAATVALGITVGEGPAIRAISDGPPSALVGGWRVAAAREVGYPVAVAGGGEFGAVRAHLDKVRCKKCRCGRSSSCVEPCLPPTKRALCRGRADDL